MKRPRIPSSRSVAPAAAMLAVAAMASVASARGGGDDLGTGDGRLVATVFQVPLVAVLLYWLYLAWKRMRESFVGNLLRRGRAAGDARTTAELTQQMRARDPLFDGDVLAARVASAFVKVRQVWRTHELEPIRPFVSDGLYERIAMQVSERRALGVQAAADGFSLTSTRLAAVSFEGRYDAATLQINTVADDVRRVETPSESGIVDRRVTEFWTFLRRRGAKTKPDAAGLMEGSCPNCGAGILGNQFADCAVCKSHLRSGEYDWVLVGIDADGEWQPSKYRRLLAVTGSAVDDFEFCVEALEDRAAVAFWRRATAMRVGDARLLDGVATQDVVRALGSSLADDGVARRFVGECAVARVELLGVARDGAMNLALVEITWSGTELAARLDAPPRRLGRTGSQTSLLVFERAASAKTRIDRGFSSAHCHGCGAPAEGASAVCFYCKETLADVNAGWALARITTREAADGRVLMDRLRAAAGVRTLEEAPSPTAGGLVAWAARVAASDGGVDARDRDGIVRVARRAGMPSSRVDQILRDALSAGSRATPEPPTRETAVEWLDAATRIAVADGMVTAGEFALLVRLGAAAGLSDSKVRALIAKAKADALLEAKTELAHARAVRAGASTATFPR